MDCSLPGSSVHGLFQARVLEWVAVALSFNCIVIHQFNLCCGEKHRLMRHEDKAQTRLRGHTLWTTALLWVEQVGEWGRGGGWVNYSLRGWGGSGLTTTKQTQDETGNQNQWWKQTHCQRTPTARKTYRTVLLQILGKKSSMKPQRNRQRILNIN